MKNLILLVALAFASTSFAQTEYKMFYLNDSGTQLDATEALLQSSKGSNVYKCQSVEMKVSKSGTSISLKNVKKPKSN